MTKNLPKLGQGQTQHLRAFSEGGKTMFWAASFTYSEAALRAVQSQPLKGRFESALATVKATGLRADL